MKAFWIIISMNRYVLVTDASYPNGGAEEFAFETVKYFHSKGIACYWFTLVGKATEGASGLDEYCQYREFKRELILELQPSSIHYIGSQFEFIDQVMPRNVTVVAGLHFWSDFLGFRNGRSLPDLNLVLQRIYHSGSEVNDPDQTTEIVNQLSKENKLGGLIPGRQYISLQNHSQTRYYTDTSGYSYPTTINYEFYVGREERVRAFTKITDNYDHFKPKPNGLPSRFRYYVPSKYAKQVFDYYYPQLRAETLEPIVTDFSKVRPSSYRPDAKYVTVINLYPEKGGRILAHLLDHCHPDVAFLGIQTSETSELDFIIHHKLKKRSNRLLSYTPEIDEILNQTRLLLVPSLVDETFCRIVAEATIKGIPVASSGYGNLSHFNLTTLGSDPEAWRSFVDRVYFDADSLRELSSLSTGSRGSFEGKPDRLVSLLRTNCLIICPYRNCGLLRQCQEYIDLLSSTHCFVALNIHNRRLECLSGVDRVYDTTIEKNYELINEICREHGIQLIISPEIVLDKTKISHNGTKIVLMPNIDLISREEMKLLEGHNVVIHNQYTRDCLVDRPDINFCQVGFALPPLITKKPPLGGELKFLLVGGLFKRTIEILRVFYRLYEEGHRNFSLTVLIGNTDPEIVGFLKEHLNDIPQIKPVYQQVSHSEVIRLYQGSHIAVVASDCEGLGFNLYEAVQTGTPVLTHQGRPHSDLIAHGVNGWCVAGHLYQSETGVGFCRLNVEAMLQQLVELLQMTEEGYREFLLKCRHYNLERFDHRQFASKFKRAIANLL
jgi:glycosyltransferase involved in cell wall biosynthesis